MGALENQKSVKLVVSLIFKDQRHQKYAETMLKKTFGPIEDITRTLPFDFTDYYQDEFGEPLTRKLICFERLVSKENIAKVKLFSNKLEDRTCLGKDRTVNIDPGYVTEAKLVLLTTKDYTHRVYVGRRIFAESTLFFQEGSFRSWPWTYPDYASSEIISYFNNVRERYVDQIKN